MAAAVGLAIFGPVPKIQPWFFALAQGFIGAMVGSLISHRSLVVLGQGWPFILGGTVWGIVMGVLGSLFLFRLKVLPGASAFWCLSPGGATVMVLISGSFGADMRIVALAQYLRVLLVSLVAVAVSGLFLDGQSAPFAPTGFFPSFEPLALAATVSAVLAGVFVANRLSVPGGLLLIPMFATVAVAAVTGRPVTLLPWIMFPCYALVGWRIGLTFNREILISSLKILPALFAATLLMIIGCSLFSLLLWKGLGLTPLTAYLAACPGGLDAVTIIAIGSGADLSFIMAMQIMRLLVVIISGPFIYSRLTRRFGHCPKP
jgi:membrane AbrB-like protein